MTSEHIDQCIEALLDNSSFYRSHPGDKAMYWASPEVLLGVVYEIVQVAANILGVAGPTVAIGSWLRKRALAKKDTARDNERSVREEIHEKIQLLKLDSFSEEDAVLVESFGEVLQFHGWPKLEAQADARKIHSIISSAIKNQTQAR